ncbi:MAG: hypothetical protein O3A00_21370 [Planctomycetota bacterium]|nr:hypothetical protein [Planctomycetota bacterium]
MREPASQDIPKSRAGGGGAEQHPTRLINQEMEQGVVSGRNSTAQISLEPEDFGAEAPTLEPAKATPAPANPDAPTQVACRFVMTAGAYKGSRFVMLWVGPMPRLACGSAPNQRICRDPSSIL